MTGTSKLTGYVGVLAVLAAVAFAGLVYLRTRPAREVPPPVAPVAVPTSKPEEPARAEDPAPAEVLAAKAELHAEYSKQKGKIPEEVAKPIEDDIGVIEGVAADLLAAIASEPDNEGLKKMLIETYRNEMKLLKKALHLSGTEDEEEAAGEKIPAAP